jgi:hypothetical protein
VSCLQFSITAGILNNLDYNLLECQGLVLAPTRELAQQIEKVMRALGDYLQVKCHACVGGTSVREDARILSAGEARANSSSSNSSNTLGKLGRNNSSRGSSSGEILVTAQR